MRTNTFILLFILFFTSLTAQDVTKGFKALEKQNFKKATKIFTELIKTKPNDVGVNYGMATIYASEQSEQTDLYKANEHIKKAKNIYTTRTDASTKKAINIYLTTEQLNKKDDEIDNKLFEAAIKSNQLAEIKKFMKKCPNSKHKKEAIAQRHKLEYWEAKSTNTLYSYNEFIFNFPNAKEIPEAKKVRDNFAFQQAKSEGKISGYKSFIKRYPDAKQIPEATELLYTLEYKKTKVANTLPAFKNFLKNYPEAPQAKSAQQYVYTVEFKKAQQKNTIESYNQFIQAHPKAAQAKKAVQVREAVKNKAIANANTIEALNKQMSKFADPISYSKIINKKAEIAGKSISKDNKYTTNQPKWYKVYDYKQLKNRATDFAANNTNLVMTGKNRKKDKWFNNAWILKCDLQGKILWEYHFGDAHDDVFNCVDINSSGEIVVGGHMDSKSSLSGEVLIMKFNPNGKVVWKKTFTGTEALDVSITQSGEVVAGGFMAQNDGNRNLFVKKFNATGNEMWNFDLPAAGIANTVKVTKTQEVIVLSNEQIIKLSTSGNVVWQTKFTEGIESYNMVINEKGNVIVAGQHYDFKKAPHSDYWIAEINTGTGSTTWQKTFDRTQTFDKASTIAAKNNQIYLGGLSSNPENTDDDIWILQLDAKGNKTKEILYGTAKNEKKPNIVIDPMGKLLLLTSIGLDADLVLMEL